MLSDDMVSALSSRGWLAWRSWLVEHVVPVRKLNSAYFHYRSNRWRWHPRFTDAHAPALDRPIFLLGTQGGGLSLISRVFRRSPHVVSVTGDYRFWSGADEAQVILEDILPPELCWVREAELSENGSDHSWIYASDALLPFYALDESNATREMKVTIERVLRSVLNLNGGRARPPVRYFDKSQSLTVRVPFLQECLRDFDPKFLLVVRNPFASVWRAAVKDGVVSQLAVPIERKVEIAAQHWANSTRLALQARERCSLRMWRFEDFLTDPEGTLSEMCAHAELPFDPTLLPAANDVIPWGSGAASFRSATRRKWYPLRADVNSDYLRSIPGWVVDVVASTCGDLVSKCGYEAPTTRDATSMEAVSRTRF